MTLLIVLFKKANQTRLIQSQLFGSEKIVYIKQVRAYRLVKETPIYYKCPKCDPVWFSCIPLTNFFFKK